MIRNTSLLASLAVLALMGWAHSAQANDKSTGKDGAKDKGQEYPHLHRALHDLHGAHTELKEAKHDFGGHREKALKAVDAAIKSIEAVLKGHKLDKLPPHKEPKSEHYPYIHHALHDLKGAEKELKEAKDNKGGHREKALHDVEHAKKELEACLKHVNNNKEKDSKK